MTHQCRSEQIVSTAADTFSQIEDQTSSVAKMQSLSCRQRDRRDNYLVRNQASSLPTVVDDAAHEPKWHECRPMTVALWVYHSWTPLIARSNRHSMTKLTNHRSYESIGFGLVGSARWLTIQEPYRNLEEPRRLWCSRLPHHTTEAICKSARNVASSSTIIGRGYVQNRSKCWDLSPPTDRPLSATLVVPSVPSLEHRQYVQAIRPQLSYTAMALVKLTWMKSQEAFPPVGFSFARLWVVRVYDESPTPLTYLGTMRSVASNIFFVVGNIQKLTLRTCNRESECLLTDIDEMLNKLSLLDLLRWRCFVGRQTKLIRLLDHRTFRIRRRRGWWSLLFVSSGIIFGQDEKKVLHRDNAVMTYVSRPEGEQRASRYSTRLQGKLITQTINSIWNHLLSHNHLYSMLVMIAWKRLGILLKSHMVSSEVIPARRFISDVFLYSHRHASQEKVGTHSPGKELCKPQIFWFHVYWLEDKASLGERA